MPTLYLLRHAKADPGQPGDADHSRVLAPKGEHDAHLIGTHLMQHHFIPDLALVSPATRTQMTWQIVSKNFERQIPTRTEQDIYDASVGMLLALIAQTPPDVENLMIVGHNPGMHELAHYFLERNSGLDDFPPGSFCAISCESGWKEPVHKGCVLKHYIMPRMIIAV